MTEAAKHTPTMQWTSSASEPAGQFIIHSATEFGPGKNQRKTLAYFLRESDADLAVKAVNAFESQERLIETLTAALDKWMAYDELLRSLPGEGPLYGGQLQEVDAAYDACVAAARTALAQARKG